VAAVGGDAVDGALVALQLAEGPQRVRVPQLEHPSPAAAQQGRGPGDHAQRAHPVAVGVRDLLLERERIDVFLYLRSFNNGRHGILIWKEYIYIVNVRTSVFILFIPFELRHELFIYIFYGEKGLMFFLYLLSFKNVRHGIIF